MKELLTGININQKLQDKPEIDPRFKSAGLNRVFVIPNNLQVKSTIFIQLAEIKKFYAIIEGREFLD